MENNTPPATTTSPSYFLEEKLDLDVLDKLVVASVRDLFASELEIKELVTVRDCKLPGLTQRPAGGPTLEDYNRHRIACERARVEVLQGNIQEAIALAKSKFGGDGAALQDGRLLFKLYKQHFIELAQAAKTSEDTRHALEWCRENLAPAALVAYPEAYDEFKSAMLSVVQSSSSSSSNLPPKLSKEKKEEEEEEEGGGSGSGSGSGAACGSACGTLVFSDRKALAGALSGAMKKTTRASQPQLVLILRHLLVLHKVFSSAKYEESSVEPRGAIAFQLVDFFDDPMLPEEGVVGCFPEGDVLTLRDAAAISNQEAIEALKRTHGDIHFALRNELGRVRLKDELLEELIAEYVVYRGLFGKETNKLWIEAACHSKALARCYREWGEGETETAKDLTSTYAFAHKIGAKVVEGKVSEAIQDVSKFFPNSSLVEKHPRLAFELKRFQLLELLKQGKLEQALLVARTDLSVLAEREPSLLPSLKKTMVAFCHVNNSSGGGGGGGEEDLDGDQNSTAEAAVAITDTILAAMSAPPPRLVQLLKSLLRAHRIWYKLEMCQDRFEDVLGIAHLRGRRSRRRKKKKKMMNGDGPNGDGGPTSMDICGEEEEEEEEEEANEYSLQFPECTILTLMEFLSSTRAQAIELLMQHDGNLEQCLETIFG